MVQLKRGEIKAQYYMRAMKTRSSAAAKGIMNFHLCIETPFLCPQWWKKNMLVILWDLHLLSQPLQYPIHFESCFAPSATTTIFRTCCHHLNILSPVVIITTNCGIISLRVKQDTQFAILQKQLLLFQDVFATTAVSSCNTVCWTKTTFLVVHYWWCKR